MLCFFCGYYDILGQIIRQTGVQSSVRLRFPQIGSETLLNLADCSHFRSRVFEYLPNMLRQRVVKARSGGEPVGLGHFNMEHSTGCGSCASWAGLALPYV
jgi:hypothetical protein